MFWRPRPFHVTILRMLPLLLLAICIPSSIAVDTCSGPLVHLTCSLSSPILASQSFLGLTLNATTPGYLKAAYPLDACSPLQKSPGALLLVVRGSCSFLEKAINVNQSGGMAMLLMDDHDGCINMGAEENETSIIDSLTLYSLSISYRSGQILMSLLNEWKEETIEITLDPVGDQRMDPSALLLLLMASGTVLMGALWSGHDTSLSIHQGSRNGDGRAEEGIQTQELEAPHAIAFVVFASASLLILFFFLNSIMFYVLLFLISISFIQSTTILLSALARLARPKLNRAHVSLPFVGEMMLSELIALPFALVAVIWWAVKRNEIYSWILQDLFGISLMLLVLRALKVQSLKVATALLSLAFFYDIFWVFLSSLFFGSSVMVTVARGGSSGEDLPMLLKVPTLSLPYEFTSYSMLGYGDVVLPGLLIAFLRRIEIQRQHDSKAVSMISYFHLSIVGYVFGLVLTFAALFFSWFGDQGQPALLYLVPCLLGSTFLLAWSRGEIVLLWNGIKEDAGSVADGTLADQEEGQPLINDPTSPPHPAPQP